VTSVRKPKEGRRAATCLLMVHRVVDRPVRDHDTSRESFLRLIDLFQARGRRFTTDPTPGADSPGVTLTFDDGTADHLAVGEELARRDIPAIFFVSADLIGLPDYLDAEGVRRLSALGHRIGSHGLRHERLDQLDATMVDRELGESRRLLESMCGRPVDLYAPVGGAPVPDLPERLERAGYAGARSTRWGIHTDIRDQWAMPCLPVTEGTLRRGWVVEAVDGMRLPARLGVLRTIKDVLPGGIRSRVRHLLAR
jgi:peptidoglycan/xylan/chitin deacetylase (PgdA/CDA1 family)